MCYGCTALQRQLDGGSGFLAIFRIFRDVFLYQTAPIHIQDIEIKTHLNTYFSLAQVEINILLLNARDITVSFSLADGKLTKSIQAGSAL